MLPCVKPQLGDTEQIAHCVTNISHRCCFLLLCSSVCLSVSLFLHPSLLQILTLSVFKSLAPTVDVGAISVFHYGDFIILFYILCLRHSSQLIPDSNDKSYFVPDRDVYQLSLCWMLRKTIEWFRQLTYMKFHYHTTRK